MTKPDPLRRFLYRLPLLLDRAGHTVATSRYTSDVRREQSLDVPNRHENRYQRSELSRQ